MSTDRTFGGTFKGDFAGEPQTSEVLKRLEAHEQRLDEFEKHIESVMAVCQAIEFTQNKTDQLERKLNDLIKNQGEIVGLR